MSAVPDTKVTTMDALRRPAAAPEQHLPVVRMGFNDLQGFELMQRAAKALAASTLVPVQYQNNMPNALIALEMAQRIGASPLMVMQNLYIVHGRPAWSSKFLIASFNQCGRFSAIRFEWIGERGKDTWGCRAWAVERATEQRIEGPTITIGLAKLEGWYEKTGSKWKTIPELMLMYRSAGWLVNTHAPEISMGLNTAEELGDVYDASRSDDGTFQVTTESLRTEHAGDAGTNGDSPPNVEAETGKTQATIFQDVMSIIEKAREITDKEVALLRLEDATALMGELSKQNAASAKKALDAVKKEIQERRA